MAWVRFAQSVGLMHCHVQEVALVRGGSHVSHKFREGARHTNSATEGLPLSPKWLATEETESHLLASFVTALKSSSHTDPSQLCQATPTVEPIGTGQGTPWTPNSNKTQLDLVLWQWAITDIGHQGMLLRPTTPHRELGIGALVCGQQGKASEQQHRSSQLCRAQRNWIGGIL